MPKYNQPNSQGSHYHCTALRKVSRHISQLYHTALARKAATLCTRWTSLETLRQSSTRKITIWRPRREQNLSHNPEVIRRFCEKKDTNYASTKDYPVFVVR
jgi:hypothetical protein